MNYEALINDETLNDQLNRVKDLSEAVSILNENGVNINAEQLKAAMVPEGELTEDALEGVAGGGKLWDWLRKFPWWTLIC